MPSALLSAPLLLAAVLAVAAHAKWRRRDSLVSAARLLRLPGWVAGPVRLLPPVELALAVALVATPWAPAFAVVSLGTLGLMLAYLGVVARGLTLSPRPACGCFGDVGSPISGSTLARNLVLSAVAAGGLAWALAGNTVPAALLRADAATWAWLAAAAASGAIAWWVAAEHVETPDAPGLAVAESSHPDPDADEYLREPIPPLMLVEGALPVTLASLARTRAQMLIWVTCGCGRSQEAVALADGWQATWPQVGVRLISTLSPDVTERMFPGERSWLFDVDGQALRSLGRGADPVAVLLGADGLLAGGPVWGLAEVRDLGDAIAEQLAAEAAPAR